MNTIKDQVKQWWAGNPQTYGDTHGQAVYGGKAVEPGSLEFYEQVDRKFYSWNRSLHGAAPFDRLFPYSDYPRGSRVLEIGCGMGTMAMNWAKRGVQMTAVDLNPVAVERTRRRFELMLLDGDIHPEDGNLLSFADNAFDYVYSWGVLHHSPNLEQSVAEMMRVLRPGGGFGIMLYNRRSLLYGYMTRYLEGFLHGEARHLAPLALASRYADGGFEEGNPHTWPVTRNELLAMFSPKARDVKVRVLGTELDSLFRLMLPGVGLLVPRIVAKAWARRWGWSLWAWGHRDA